MFGVWRTVLALLVVAFHLLPVPVIGDYAVFAFFVLSGFLMTTIMHETYGYDGQGLRRYTLNRFLRLYPNYWLTALIALAVIWFCGESFVRTFKPGMYVPRAPHEVLFNAAMFFPSLFPNRVWPRLSPPTWALTIEITYYIAIGLGVSKTKSRSLIWLAASALYVLATIALHLPHRYRYGAIPAGSLPFAVGACLYFYKEPAHRLLDRLRLGLPIVASACVLVLVAFTLAGYLGHANLAAYGIYLDIVCSAALLIRLKSDGIKGLPRAVDKLIGDYSYPIYLLHFPLAALAAYLLTRIGLRPDAAPFALFALDLVLVAVVATFMIFMIDPTIEGVRARVRGRRAARPPLFVTAPVSTPSKSESLS